MSHDNLLSDKCHIEKRHSNHKQGENFSVTFSACSALEKLFSGRKLKSHRENGRHPAIRHEGNLLPPCTSARFYGGASAGYERLRIALRIGKHQLLPELQERKHLQVSGIKISNPTATSVLSGCFLLIVADAALRMGDDEHPLQSETGHSLLR